MTRTVVLLMTFLTVAPAPDGSASRAVDTLIFEDGFDSKLAKGWSWVREQRDGWRLKDGLLEILPMAGNLWEGENGAKNLLLRPVERPEESVAIEVTVTNDPREFGEQAGLLWYVDDDNYVKLVKEWYDGRSWIVLASERGGKAEYAEAHCDAKTVGLRLVVSGKRVTGQFRDKEGAKWADVKTFDLPNGKAKAGINAHAPAGASRWAAFDNFRIVRLTEK